MDEQTATVNPTSGGPAPIYGQSQEKNAKWLWLLIILIIIGALVFAFFKGIGPFAKLSPFAKKEVASPTPQVIASPPLLSSPSAMEGVDRAKPAVRILNGSGVAGLASSVKDMLENLGWRVINVGNANAYDFDQTQVRIKSDFASYQEPIVKDLSDKYSIKVSSSTLDSTDSADIEIVVGKK